MPRDARRRADQDFSHLSVGEIDAELAAISTNMEKDLEKVKRQYHKREKALQKARAEKVKGQSGDVD